MGWIIAGIAAVGAIASASAANKEEKAAADLEKFQGRIDVERLKSDTALASYNMTRENSALESHQVAMSAAMGKQAGVGSVANIQDVGRADLADNIGRMDDEVARAEKFGAVSDSARDRSAAARSKQRNIGAGTTGLLSFAKAFA